MISLFEIRKKGDFNEIQRFFHRALRKDYLNIIADHANEGIDALRKATPEDSGKTAESWGYEIVQEKGKTKLIFTNDNINEGCNVAILLIYGHGAIDGGYVEGIDFVTPALRPIFRDLANKIWREVRR